jgi:uncharacterized protein YkuJ
MAVPGHDERDFDFAVEYHLPIVSVYKSKEEPTREFERDGETLVCTPGDGVSENSDFLNGKSVAEAKTAIIERLEELGKGVAKVKGTVYDINADGELIVLSGKVKYTDRANGKEVLIASGGKYVGGREVKAADDEKAEAAAAAPTDSTGFPGFTIRAGGLRRLGLRRHGLCR